MKFYISYGFLGGKLTSEAYMPLMATARLDFTDNPLEAEVILAHSAGCWHLPDAIAPSLLVLVGMPLQHANITQTFRDATRHNRRLFIANRHKWIGLKIFAYSTLYGIVQPKRNYKIVRALKQENLYPAFTGAKRIVFVANKYDPYPHSIQLPQLIAARPDICFISMPGSHQDIWEHPERYLNLLQSDI